MTRSVLFTLDETNPNKVDPALHELPLGRAMNLLPKFYRGTVTAHVLTLPDGSKASAILSAFATIGTVVGYFTPIVASAALATTQCKITPTGDILFLAADAVTEAEVVYVTVEGELITRTIQVVAGTGVGALPSTDVGVLLLSATVTAGTTLGAKTVLVRTAGAPATTEVRLAANGDNILFAVADAVTLATVTYLRVPARTVDAALRTQISY